MSPWSSPPLTGGVVTRREPWLWLSWCVGVIAAAAAAFLVPALQRTGGLWPAPLDDVYIYFGFARSLALGHGLSWVPGNGYSSGATSALYPLLLAPGWLLGFRGPWLGVWASLLAVAWLVDLCGSIRAIVTSRLVAYAAPVVIVSVPLLDWSWFSGMETALLGALVGRALRAAARCRSSTPAERPARQVSAGVWLALLALVRPEAAALCLALGLFVTWHARALGTAGSLARALGPLVGAMLLQGATNRLLTGEWMPAGAIRKLMSSNPHLDGPTLVIEVLKNLVVLEHQALERALGAAPLGLLVPLLALFAVVSQRHRGLAASLLAGAVALVFAVSLNTTARFQNYRYAAPALAMLLVGACLGLDALAGVLNRPRHRRTYRRAGRGAVLALAVLTCGAAYRELDKQIDHFGRASRNIALQQVEVAMQLGRMRPPPRRVLVGDAGAIPYLSGLPAVDGLGLGGYHDLPFARASVHGVPAVVELIERLGPDERPDWLALYPGWWPGLVDRFGTRVGSVRIDDNVICAADEKVIYRASWEMLEPRRAAPVGLLDELDVADLVDERAHDYELPSPHAGWITDSAHRVGAHTAAPEELSTEVDEGSRAPRGPSSDGVPALRWDAGRIAPEGSTEQWTVRASVVAGPARLVVRTDPTTSASLRVAVVRGGAEIHEQQVEVEPAAPGHATDEPFGEPPPPGATTRFGAAAWNELTVALPTVAGLDRIRIEISRGPWRSYHLWLLRPP